MRVPEKEDNECTLIIKSNDSICILLWQQYIKKQFDEAIYSFLFISFFNNKLILMMFI